MRASISSSALPRRASAPALSGAQLHPRFMRKAPRLGPDSELPSLYRHTLGTSRAQRLIPRRFPENERLADTGTTDRHRAEAAPRPSVQDAMSVRAKAGLRELPGAAIPAEFGRPAPLTRLAGVRRSAPAPPLPAVRGFTASSATRAKRRARQSKPTGSEYPSGAHQEGPSSGGLTLQSWSCLLELLWKTVLLQPDGR